MTEVKNSQLRLRRPSVTRIFAGRDLAAHLEWAARLCTGTENRLSGDSLGFLRRLWRHGHFSVFEQVSFSFLLPHSHQLPVSSYLAISGVEDGVIVSGSFRAFIEADNADELRYLVNQILPILENAGLRENHDIVELRQSELGELLPPSEFEKHARASLLFNCSRVVSHELVRHRVGSFLQRSQRVRGSLEFIRQDFASMVQEACWKAGLKIASICYYELLGVGATPELARRVLPGSTATKVLATMTLRDWRGFFELRDSKQCDPEMQLVAAAARRLVFPKEKKNEG